MDYPTAERNRQIVADRESGMTLREIGEKYGLSQERVRQITQNYAIGQRTRMHKAIRNAEEEARRARQERSNPMLMSLSKRTRNALRQINVRDDTTLLALSDEDISRGRNIGPVARDEINRARGR
jgi:DNA-directed RNA polymerase sigma subunit (sigma70/sigma32)